MLNEMTMSREFQGGAPLNPKPIQGIGVDGRDELAMRFSKTHRH
jgi:hypothetical protein